MQGTEGGVNVRWLSLRSTASLTCVMVSVECAVPLGLDDETVGWECLA